MSIGGRRKGAAKERVDRSFAAPFDGRLIAVGAPSVGIHMRERILGRGSFTSSAVSVALRIIGSIARRAELVVDGDHILHEEERHHHEFEDQTHDDGAEEHEQETVTAQPCPVAEDVGGIGEQQEEAEDDHPDGVEYVESLIDFLGDERPEVENVMQDATGAVQLRPLFLRNDEDEGCNDRHDRQYDGDRRESSC